MSSIHSRLPRLRRPRDRRQLAAWAEIFGALRVADHPVCPGHHLPLDYLDYVFFERGAQDPVVWACRGGGKTRLGAVATLLDMLFKPRIQIRILGGSREQSQKMYEHLAEIVDRHFLDLVRGGARGLRRRGFQFRNGSRVEILTQSQTSVRGVRVQKLRCDEVELFDPAIWSAAQLTTRSLLDARGRLIARGSVEAFSTMHHPGGLMHQILHRPPADGPGGGGGGSGDGGGGGGGGRRVFSWCIWEVMGPCAPARDCGRCPLAADCAGRVKHADGWMPLADVRAMHARISRPVWESEMLCRRPYAADAVFAAFRCRRHVRPWPGGDPAPGEPVSLGDHPATVEALVAGVDFGWRTFVCLWIAMLRDPRGRRCLWVLDELVRDESTLAASIDAMKCRTPPAAGPADRRPWTPAVVYCDVAGRQKNAHTGQSSEQILRRAGFRVVSSAMNIADGIDALLELIDPALPSVPAETRFLVTPHCVHTIAALEGYRRQPDGTPRKDGRHDHLIDALRYALVNHDRRPAATTARLY